ncbi:MAG: GntR family transcriptional regulator [Desulfoplanes sp.]
MERKSDQVYREIRNRIQENYWKPDEKIYSERDLAKTLCVSRVTIRRAITQLVKEGFLTYKTGHNGTFVTDKARMTRQAPSSFVCVAIDNSTPAFASLLLEGIHDSLAPKGFQTIYSNTHFGGEQASSQIDSILRTGISGLIFAPLLGKESDTYNRTILNLARQHNIPLIQVDREYFDTNCDWVGCNNYDAMKHLTTALFEEGKTNIQVAYGYKTTSTEERMRGILSAMENHPEASLHVVHLDEEEFLLRGETIIQKGSLASNPDVIIGLNQIICHAAKHLPQLGKDIPTATIASCIQECDSDYGMIQPMYEIGNITGLLMSQRIIQPTFPPMHIYLQARLWKSPSEIR